MRRIIVISLFFLSVALLAVVVWPDSLLTRAARWKIERHCQSLFGQKLRYRCVEYDGSAITFYEPLFYDGLDGEGGGGRISAAQLRAQFTVQMKRPMISIDLEFDQPRIELAKSEAQLPKLGWKLQKGRSLVHPQIACRLCNGLVELHDLSEGRSTHLPLELNYQSQPSRSTRLTASSSFGTVEYESSEWGSLLTFNLPSNECTSVARLLHFFVGERCSGLDLTGGHIVGAGRLWLPAEGQLLADGSIEMRALDFVNDRVGFCGAIPAVALRFCADPAPLGSEEPSLRALVKRTICQFSATEGGLIAVAAERMPSWEFAFDRAAAKIHGTRLTGTLDGQVTSDEWNSSLRTEGEMRLGLEPNVALEMAWPQEGSTAHSHLAWSAHGKRGDQIDVELVDIGPEHARFLQSIASCLYPQAADLQLNEGSISARIRVDFDQWHPRHLAVDHFELSDLCFAYPPHQSTGSIASAHGYLSSEITDTNPIKNLTGLLSIEGGDLIQGSDHHWEGAKGEVELVGGALRRLSLMTDYREMELALLYQPLAAKSELHLSLNGRGKQIAAYLPPAYREPFTLHFSDDDLLLRASVTPHLDRLELAGSCAVAEGREELSFEVDFDLVFAEEDDRLPSWVAELIDSQRPARPLSGLALREGEVRGADLPLDRYAPVLALLEPYITVDGQAEMVAHFDKGRVDVEYEASDVRFATDLFEVHVDQLGNLSDHGIKATHSVDIASGEQLGVIPVRDATCWIREGDLTFPQVDGEVRVTGGRVEVGDIVAHADGVQFQGALDLDRSDESASYLHLSAPTARGRVCDAQRLCARYSDLALWDLPITGSVETREKGLDLYFCFRPEVPADLDVTVSGVIADGMWSSRTLSISDGHLTFDYDHEPQRLRLRNIDADLVHRDGRCLMLGGRGADINDVRRLLGTFDLSLFDGECEEARFAGSCQPLKRTDPDGLWALELDGELTRIGQIRPHLTHCHLNGWSEVVAARAHPRIELETALHDLRLLTLLPALGSTESIEWLLGEEPSGELLGELLLGDGDEPCRVAFVGDGVTVCDREFERLEVAGGKRDEKWWLDRFSTGDLTMTGRVVPTEVGYHFDHCLVERPSQFSLLVCGDYQRQSSTLNGQIVEGWARVDHSEGDLRLTGELVGEGSISLQLGGERPIVDSFAVRLLPDHFSIDGRPIVANSPLPLFGGHGRPLIAGPGSIQSGEIELGWDRIVYNLAKEEIAHAALRFDLPADELAQLCKLGEQIESIVCDLTPSKRLVGEVGIERGHIDAKLQSGPYLLGGVSCDLTAPRIEWSGELVEASAQFQVGRRHLELYLRADPSQLDRGCALVYDGEASGSRRPLLFDWHWEEDVGLAFDAIEGEICGLRFDLTPYDPASPACQPSRHRGALAAYSTPGEMSQTARPTQPIVARGEGKGTGPENTVLASGEAAGEGGKRGALASGHSSGKGETRAQSQLAGGEGSGSGVEAPLIAGGESSGEGEQRGAIASGGSSGSGGINHSLRMPPIEEGARAYWGRVEIDGSEGAELLPEAIASLCQKIGIGAGYELEGIVYLGAHSLPVGFQGKLYGQKAHLAHLDLDRLSTNVMANRSEVAFSNFQIADGGGTLYLPTLNFWTDDAKQWRFSSPLIQLSEVTPTELKLEGDLPGALRAIAVPRAVFRGVEGAVADMTSWKGSGFIQVDSTISRTPLPGIFALPADILGRLGLESGNLTPAMGGVSFEIGDGRCTITQFHDLYSRSQHSQFFLAKDQGPSYIDFDGNIEIALRMKQYNLLLKFTEMFLVNVRGRVTDPSCSLAEDKRRR